jgi:hypothetical protein
VPLNYEPSRLLQTVLFFKSPVAAVVNMAPNLLTQKNPNLQSGHKTVAGDSASPKDLALLEKVGHDRKPSGS